jgi:hypothetical protein
MQREGAWVKGIANWVMRGWMVELRDCALEIWMVAPQGVDFSSINIFG